MAQIKIKTNVGEVSIDFTDVKNLENQLQKIDFKELEKIISKNVPTLTFTTNEVIEEFKDLYRINKSGIISLTKIPQTKGDAIKLAIFLSEQGLTTNELKIATGISNPKAYMNKKEFVENGKYITLNTNARKDVLEKIIPNIRKSN